MKKIIASLLASIFVLTSVWNSTFIYADEWVKVTTEGASVSKWNADVLNIKTKKNKKNHSKLNKRSWSGSLRENKNKKDVSQTSDYVPWELIVKFKTGKINLKKSSDNTKIDNFAKSKKLEKREQIKQNNIEIMWTSSWETVENAIARVKTDENVEYVQPNYIYYPTGSTPNDASFSKLWGLQNNWQSVNGTSWTSGADIKWTGAMNIFQWTSSQSVTGTIVAVIDAWVAYNHPDLSNQMWDGSNCKDENGNYLGWCAHGYNYAEKNKNPLPTESSHGTHIAGTIAAQMNNARWVTGVNPNGKIMAIKTSFTTTDNVKAINFAKQNGAKIINASWWCAGGDWNWTHFVCGSWANYQDQMMIDAINSFPGLFITAAGNGDNDSDVEWDNHDTWETHHSFPCDLSSPNIICVTATDQNDNLATFADYWNTSVDVGAPGTNIYSTVDDSIVLNETFGGVSAPNVPNGWVKWGNTTNYWWTYNYSGNNVLYGDLHSTYVSNADTNLTSPSYNLSNSAGATFSFITACDTEYNPNYWTDYMSLEVSGDGWNTFSEILSWDEAFIDNDSNTSGSAVYNFEWLPIPQNYLTSNFKFRLRWRSNSTDNAHDGCLVDNMRITKYSDGSDELYGYMDGTSMATPQVVGLASLAWSYRPDLGYSEIKKAILDNGDAVASLAGKTVTGKRINAYNTLLALTNPGIANLKIYSDWGKTKPLSDGDWSKTITPYIEWTDAAGQSLSSYDIRMDYSSGYTLTWAITEPIWNVYGGTTTSKSMSGVTLNSNGDYIIYIRGKNSFGKTGDWTTAKIHIDNLGPSAPNLISPINNTRIWAGPTNLRWNPAIDAGVWMKNGNYRYIVASMNDINTLLADGTTSSTGVSVPSLWDGEYYWRILPIDSLWNTWTLSSTGLFIKDTIPPAAPSNIHLNNDVLIDAAHVGNISLVWSGQVVDSGSIVKYVISNGIKNITGTGILDNSGSFVIDHIDTSSLPDGNLTIVVTLLDDVWNESSSCTSTVYQDALAPTGTISFLSGLFINSTWAIIHLTSSEPVEYAFSWDILEASTGSLQSSQDINIRLTEWDGIKNVSVQYKDLWGNISPTYSAHITLDGVAPTINISSHIDGAKIAGASTTLTGTTSDDNGILSVKINNADATGTGTWKKEISLNWWTNIVKIEAKDVAWNITTKNITLIRIADKPKTFASIVGMWDAQIIFDTDITSTGSVKYGTDPNNLTNTLSESQSGKHHSIRISGLSSGSKYYYVAFGIVEWSDGVSSEEKSFITPQSINTSNPGSFTGAIHISGSTSSWVTLNGTGTIEVHSSDNSGSISIPANSFEIHSTNSSWDGIIEPPTLTQWSGSVILSGYSRLMDLTFKIGSVNSPLNFSGWLVTVHLPVWYFYNGKTLKIHRSDDEQASFMFIADCIVANGICTFQTNSFSVFTALDPTDDVPDAFSFTSQSNVEANSIILSDLITLSWLNVSTGATVSGGNLVINGVDSGTSGMVSNGSFINIKLLSSSSYSTPKSATLTIGWVSATFIVTTKSTPSIIVSNSQWWGGGGYVLWKDKCPDGDTSPSYYDGICSGWTRNANGGSTQNKYVTPNEWVTTKDLKFKDVVNHWSYWYVARLAIKWVINNTENFNPENWTTRAEFIKMVVLSIIGKTPDTKAVIPYEDVEKDSWAIPYLAYALQNWLIRDSKEFRPNDKITREEAIKILMLALESETGTLNSKSFSDVESTSDFKAYIEAAKERRIITGQELNGKLYFRPHDNISRAEIAKMLVKAFK